MITQENLINGLIELSIPAELQSHRAIDLILNKLNPYWFLSG